MNILDKILEQKKEDVAVAQKKIPEDRLREQAEQRKDRRSLYEALKDVITQYPLIHGEPVPAWIRNGQIAISKAEDKP